MHYPETMKIIAIFTILVLAGPLWATEVYKTVDSNGNIIFSDEPTEGAEKIDVPEPMIVPSLTDYPPLREEAEEAEPYNTLAITSPKQDETYFRSEGDLKVTVQVRPGLSRSDTVVLYLNGVEQLSGRATSFSLPELDRGTHQLSVAIRDREGTILKTSEPVTFHMRQNSVLNPQNTSKPAP